jgi:hypothetical protein
VKARHFFDVWKEAVSTVASARDPRGVPLCVGLNCAERDIAARHGDAIGADGRAYVQRLFDETRIWSAAGRQR